MKHADYLLVLSALIIPWNTHAAVIYDNGLISGKINAYSISTGVGWGFSVSDSFTVASDASLTKAEVGIWTRAGTMTSVDWHIGTTPFGDDISHGTSTVINSFYDSLYSDFINTSTFDISGVVRAGITYYLTLNNATSPATQGIYWDENFGPSAAYARSNDGKYRAALPGSESFKLYDAVPEPSTYFAGLSALGMLGMFGWRNRK